MSFSKSKTQDENPPPYTLKNESDYILEIQKLNEEITLLKRQETERLRDTKSLYDTACQSLQSACALTIKQLVEQTLVTVAEPVMNIVRHHDNILGSSLFPVHNPNMFMDNINIPQQILSSLGSCKLLPNEMIVKIVCAATDSSSSSNRPTYLIFTSFGRQASVSYHYSETSYKLVLTGQPIPLTNEYIELARHYSGYQSPHIYSTGGTYFEKLVATYRKHYPLASDMQKNHILIEELKSQQSITSSMIEDYNNKSKILEVEKEVFTKDKQDLICATTQLKKRLKVVALRENECNMRYTISEARTKIVSYALKLLDSCDTVDNEIIGCMVQQIIDDLQE